MKAVEKEKLEKVFRKVKSELDFAKEETKWDSEKFRDETDKLIASVGKEKLEKVFAYPFLEIDEGFIAFIETYKKVSDTLPKNFSVIDIGCYLGVQGDYFKDFDSYIGVEPECISKLTKYVGVNDKGEPLFETEEVKISDYFLEQDNAFFYAVTGQEFISDILPKLYEEKVLDPEKTFCICSAVPDEKLQRLVKDTFKYFRVTYPTKVLYENFPEQLRKKDKAKAIERE